MDCLEKHLPHLRPYDFSSSLVDSYHGCNLLAPRDTMGNTCGAPQQFCVHVNLKFQLDLQDKYQLRSLHLKKLVNWRPSVANIAYKTSPRTFSELQIPG